MKQPAFTLMLFVVVLSPLAAACQVVPDSPAPAAGQQSPSASDSSSTQAAQPDAPQAAHPPDWAWRRIQQLAHGDPIVVTSSYGPSLACRFAGATDDALFCDSPGSPEGTGYGFDRASVISVQVTRPERNYHPGWIASIIGGGLAVGLIATRDHDAADSARIGAVGALVVGAIGAPLALLPQQGSVAVVYHPHALRLGGRGPLGLRPHSTGSVRR